MFLKIPVAADYSREGWQGGEPLKMEPHKPNAVARSDRITEMRNPVLKSKNGTEIGFRISIETAEFRKKTADFDFQFLK